MHRRKLTLSMPLFEGDGRRLRRLLKRRFGDGYISRLSQISDLEEGTVTTYLNKTSITSKRFIDIIEKALEIDYSTTIKTNAALTNDYLRTIWKDRERYDSVRDLSLIDFFMSNCVENGLVAQEEFCELLKIIVMKNMRDSVWDAELKGYLGRNLTPDNFVRANIFVSELAESDGFDIEFSQCITLMGQVSKETRADFHFRKARMTDNPEHALNELEVALSFTPNDYDIILEAGKIATLNNMPHKGNHFLSAASQGPPDVMVASLICRYDYLVDKNELLAKRLISSCVINPSLLSDETIWDVSFRLGHDAMSLVMNAMDRILYVHNIDVAIECIEKALDTDYRSAIIEKMAIACMEEDESIRVRNNKIKLMKLIGKMLLEIF